MNRRRLLETVAVGSTVAVSGCLGSFLGDDAAENVVLGPPDDQVAESGDLAYPAYGEPFPTFSLPDPVAETTVDVAALDGVILATAFYSYCDAECVPLIDSLAGVQHGTADEGIADDVTVLAITFDPERDTAEALADHGDRMRVDLELGNWHYLRPEDDAAVDRIVVDELGIGIERVGPEDAYDFNHITITSLVNPDGYVERAYREERLPVEDVLADVEAVLSGYDERTTG